jgi:oligopeptide/dipeptide ABC transporter ATP-binding protein
MTASLLKIEDLRVRVHSRRSDFLAVDRLSMTIAAGEAVGLIGESGSGKSLTALSLARLLPRQVRLTEGSISFDGKNLVDASEDEMRRLRRRDIAMIFQDPSTCLNPLLTIGDQIAEAAGRRSFRRGPARQQTLEALKLMAISDPLRVAESYPHELSGGMQQRAVIACALVRQPRLIIADEPTTALDATVQSEILAILKNACQRTGAALLFISHDLAVIASLCRRVYIMYAGQVVEEGPTQAIFQDARHPYTRGLLDSILDPWRQTPVLRQIGGDPPDPANPPAGCRFHPRCQFAFAPCSVREPAYGPISPARRARCWLLSETNEDGR